MTSSANRIVLLCLLKSANRSLDNSTLWSQALTSNNQWSLENQQLHLHKGSLFRPDLLRLNHHCLTRSDITMKPYALPIISSLAVSAYAASHSIDVGEDGLVFSPNSTTAAVGDTVTFHYYPRAHGVARSSYSSPCAAIDNGFNSGFVKVASGESNTTFTITINNTDPIWYYCPQGDHCQAGMVGVINPP
jgi:plastocyanin